MRNSEPTSPAPSRDFHDQLWMVPYARNPYFCGREEELQAIAARLNETNSTGGLALSGAGGVGKTQLALEYTYLHREKYRYIFWVSAETRETLHAAYNDIAELLTLPEKGQQEQRRIIEAVTHWLEMNTSWLLILDFVGEQALLKDFLPGPCNGHILLTTRANTSGKLVRHLRVKTLTLQQSSRLILCRSGLFHETDTITQPTPKDDEDARAIASQLNCQPLALNLAGAYLAETSCGLPGYLTLLRSAQMASLHSDAASAEEQPDPLLKVVFLSREKIAQTGFTAADLLSLCAFLAPDEILESLLVACSAVLQKPTRKRTSNTSKQSAALTTLHNYALLERDLEVRSLTISHEIQTIWRSLLPTGAERSWAEQTVRAIGTIFTTLDVNDWEACQRLLPHAQVCAAHIEHWQLELVEGAWLLHYMGWYLHMRRQYPEAQRYEERALTMYRTVLGDEHPSTAMILNDLAITYEDQGKLHDAAALHMQALAIRRRVLGENHPETATSMNNLALVSHKQRKFDDAASLYRQALTIRLQLLGDSHPDIATLLADLAALSAEQGKLNDALALYQQALAIRRKSLGGRHPDTIALLSSLAATSQAQGNWDEAIHWYQQALAAQRKTLGYEHPDIATTFSSLATIYQTQGELDEAAFWLQHALALLSNEPTYALPVQARALETLAAAYEKREKHEKAEALYQQALALYRRGPEGSPLDLARCSYHLALLYHERRRNAEARLLLEQALALWQEHRGSNHADIRKAREIYEQIMQKQKKTRLKQMQPDGEQAFEPEHNNISGLKGIAQVIRLVRRKKT